MATLDIRNLSIDITTSQGVVRVVDKVSFTISDGSIHGLIGESGSGKSLIAKAILGLNKPNWKITADRMFIGKMDLTKLSDLERRKIMGKEIAMIFQRPSSYLDPTKKIIVQINEVLPKIKLIDRIKHYFSQNRDKYTKIEKLLHKVGIQDVYSVMHKYPHELSEGVCQKVMIAMAISNDPRLIIADEPTNAMEGITQAQIFRLLYKLNKLHNTTILLLSSDFSNVSNLSDRISIIYCGQIIESGSYQQIVKAPKHPYTEVVLKTILDFKSEKKHKSLIYTLPGSIPPLNNLPVGCRLGPRCPRAQRACVNNPISVNIKGHSFSCHFPINNKIEQVKCKN